jgi:hypothetical protein
MSAFRGKADYLAYLSERPLIAKRRHFSHQRAASPHENNARQSRETQRGPSPLLSSNNRTSRHPRYIIRRHTITPPINPTQSIVRPCFNPLYSIPACQHTLPLMMCAQVSLSAVTPDLREFLAARNVTVAVFSCWFPALELYKGQRHPIPLIHTICGHRSVSGAAAAQYQV